jgi:putative ABC transport system permease protein
MSTFSAVVADLFAACVQPGWTQDVRHACRSLVRAWGFTTAIVCLLGMGLGITTAIFSIFYGILLRPLPYASPDSLVRIDWMLLTGQTEAGTLGELAVWREGARQLSAIGAYSSTSTEIRGRGAAETVQVTYVSASTLPMLGVHPQLGRTFDAAQDVPNGDVHKVLLSDALWTRAFGRDPAILGRVLQQGDGSSLEIVGVMPVGFAFPVRTEMWVPIESFWARAPLARQRPTSRIYGIVGRLASSASVERARDELDALSSASKARPVDAAVRVRTWRQAETGNLRPYLLALLGGVGCLALICITNVSGLQLARGTSRAREFAIRSAIGASTGRNLRIQLAESLVLGVAGALVSAAVSIAVLRLLVSSIPVALPAWMHFDVDAVALLFCIGLAIIAAVISGVLPAARAMTQNGEALLRSGGRGATDRAGIRYGLVIGEIALSTVLLVTACLLLQTLLALQQREPGFRPEGLLIVKVTRAQAGSVPQRLATLPPLHARVLDRLRGLPGVTSIAGSSRLPFASGANNRTIATLYVTGSGVSTQQTPASFFGAADVMPGYFETMGIPLLRGRTFTANDDAKAGRVVIVSERGAQQLWPGRDPIGQQVTWGTPRPDNPATTVVGVVANLRDVSGDDDRGMEFYYPYPQYPGSSVFYVIRTSIDPVALIAPVRETIAAAEPSIAIASMKTMPQWIDESLWQTRLWAWLFGMFAGLALLLAAAGLYSLVSYLVARRAKEVAIRMSVGATGGAIMRLILGGMLRLIVIGVVVGVAASIAASRLIATLLFQVTATDIRSYLAVSLMVVVVTVLACCPPILRTRRVDVVSVLHEDQ